MKEEELIKWIERLVEIHRDIKNSQGQFKQDRINQIFGYIESGEYILSLLKPHRGE